MSDPTLLAVVFWAFFLLDGAQIGRCARFSFVSWFGGRRARPAHRRWHVYSPWPGGWRTRADDLPFSFAPSGLCNWPAGSAARPAATPETVQAWRWEEITEVQERAGRLLINGQDFCPATPHLSADGVRALAAACGPLSPDARARLLRTRLRLWLRPAHLRRRALVLRARTQTLATANALALLVLAAITAGWLGFLPELIGTGPAARLASALPLAVAYLICLHVGAVALAWRARTRLQRLDPHRPPSKNPLPGVLFFPPQALHLRALLGEDWFPASHPAAAALALAPLPARDEIVFNVLADLRWPLSPPGAGPLASEILGNFRAELEHEIGLLLCRARLDPARLLAPPKPDGPQSRTYCPRCGAQFVTEKGTCPRGVPLRPLP